MKFVHDLLLELNKEELEIVEGAVQRKCDNMFPTTEKAKEDYCEWSSMLSWIQDRIVTL